MLNRAIAEIEAGKEDWASYPPLADMQAEDASAIAQVISLHREPIVHETLERTFS